MAAPKEENVVHDFSLSALLDNEVVTITCTDKAQNKGYKVEYTKKDYANINDEFDKMKKAIEGPNAKINAPSYNGGPLVVKCDAYEFVLQQT
mmetsp:Transcript_31855/g.51548  ORF Transcript_31855/g.51548 Transcript_31855/m.51548 type:complete len:92 (-) Transcript_31855:151-426(-)